jgi:hypothetical protein
LLYGEDRFVVRSAANGRFSLVIFCPFLGDADDNMYGERRFSDLFMQFVRLVVKLRNFCTLRPLDKICGVWYKLNMACNFALELSYLVMFNLFSLDFIGKIAMLGQSTQPPPPEKSGFY